MECRPEVCSTKSSTVYSLVRKRDSGGPPSGPMSVRSALKVSEPMGSPDDGRKRMAGVIPALSWSNCERRVRLKPARTEFNRLGEKTRVQFSETYWFLELVRL